ncbi:MAG: PH domain-containing protein [Candidatus Micrarchaeota archaeon]|nr:PH domain-containing protein [Candidatus Micrarchaeota archaeon]MDE1848385.1 PH domain-containing protein [Candidatus Micrarchaeota archaeon]MDE1864305.1 PH domain-containing protein [Candidatus Micrarchaeota archaeon]
MAAEQREIGDISEILGPNEKIEARAEQRRLGPGGELTTPITIIATDQKLIVINRTRFGIKKDYEIVQYGNVVSAKLINGFISSSVIIRVRGYKIGTGHGNSEEINGFVNDDAKRLVEYINKRIGSAPQPGHQAAQAQPGAIVNGAPAEAKVTGNPIVAEKRRGEFVFCTSCGGKNLSGSKFCSSCGKQML